jgi:hypothetical protein
MNIKGLLFVCALLSAAVFSCKKDSNEVKASMGAKIYTVNLENDTINWSAVTRVTVLKNEIFTITGTSLNADLSNDVLAITVNGVKPETYTLNPDPLNFSAQCGCAYTTKFNGASVVFLGTSGNVVITKVDTGNKLISGTFEFSVLSGNVTKTITKGTFENLKYVVK